MCLFALQLLAQSGGIIGVLFKKAEKQGDWFYDQYAYADALKAYKKAYKDNTTSDALKLKIAESLHKLNKPVEAEAWYSKVEAKDSVFQAEQMLHYSQSLSSTGKYPEAEAWYQRYQQRMTAEGRFASRIAGSAAYAELEEKNANTVRVAPVSFNTPAAEFSPGYYQQGLVFVSGRAAGDKASGFKWDKSTFLDIYYLPSKDAALPQKFSPEINSPYHEGPMVFYQDDQKLIFTRNNYRSKRGISSDGVTKLKLYYSEKSAKGVWSNPVELPFNSDEFSTGHPAISLDGSVLYFASDRLGGFGGTDLYKAEYKDGEWQAPVNLGPKINTEGSEMFPFLHQDRYLYFASNGHPGMGGLDIHAVDMKRKEPQIINLGAPMNSKFDDFGFVAQGEGVEGYFSSNREGGSGNDDVYAFAAKKPFFVANAVTGKIKDVSNGKSLAGALVHLLDHQGKTLDLTVSDEDGSYYFKVEPLNNYQLKVEKTGFVAEQKKLITLEEEGPEWIYDLHLQEEGSYMLYAIIQETFTNEFITGVLVRLIDAANSKPLVEEETGTSGEFKYVIPDKKPQDDINYSIKLTKKGYLSKSVKYSTTLGEPGRIELNELMQSAITKAEVGMDVSKFIELKPIIFDLDKSKIRPDAAAELDKVVRLLEDNPDIVIELGSHTDSRGSSYINLQLSEKRAKASVAYIISKGIDASRIQGKGYGEYQIINRCKEGLSCTEAEHQENRRTVLKIVQF